MSVGYKNHIVRIGEKDDFRVAAPLDLQNLKIDLDRNSTGYFPCIIP